MKFMGLTCDTPLIFIRGVSHPVAWKPLTLAVYYIFFNKTSNSSNFISGSSYFSFV